MNEGLQNTEQVERTSPAIEAQREVLRAIAEGIDLEMAKIAFKRRFQGSLNDWVSNPMLVNSESAVRTVDNEFIEMLRARVACVGAKQSNVNREKMWLKPQRNFKAELSRQR